MSANSTYSNYKMPPYLHIQRAEQILAELEDAMFSDINAQTLTAIAQVHVGIAQAQMQGNGQT